jgi:2-dehydro-3-deoxygluconokinase
MSFTAVVTLGETMGLMKAETPGPLAQVHSLSLGMGGSESNFAIALSRLGTSVTWAGRVGDDSLGELVLRELAAEGVVVDPLRDPAAPTGIMIKERRTLDQLKVWYYRAGSAGSRLSPDDVPLPEIVDSWSSHMLILLARGPRMWCLQPASSRRLPSATTDDPLSTPSSPPMT